ncbi:MAG: hypothetical protein VCC00_07605 [Deltaproteobacteria bacterium]
MPTDFTTLLWLLKLGALVNLYFLAQSLALPPAIADPQIVVPAQILFAVSAYRCLFPNRYKNNVVFHATPLSSTLVTRVLATAVEVAWIYQFAYVIRLLNVDDVAWVNVLSWLMLAQVVISQGFVWGAILTGRLELYFYEELGWGLIFAANTLASAFLYWTIDSLGEREILLQLNLLFGLIYLPWQLIHLRWLRADARAEADRAEAHEAATWASVRKRLYQSLHETNRATDAASWGGAVGLVWMTAYWASLIPLWVHQVVVVFAG